MGSQWKLIPIGAVAILVLCGITTAIAVTSYDKGPELGAISIYIDGRDAVLSAAYTLPPGVRVRNSDLELVSGDTTYPVVLAGGKASVELGVTDVASMLNRGTASIAGSVRASLRFPPITVDQSVDRSIDIASYLSLNNTLKADNITVGFLGLGEVKVSLDFKAELPSDISLDARNTSAKIVTDYGSTPGRIDRLILDNDGSGMAVVRIPSVSLLPLLLGNNRILVDFWGFKFSFDYPVSG